MKKTHIKVGRWYETLKGVGECLRNDSTHPPSVAIRIDRPVPRGILNFAPREVLQEVPAPPPTRVG